MSGRLTDPSLEDLFHAWLEQHALETYTAFPGRLQGYDPETQTGDVVPLVRHPVPQPDGGYSMEDLPVIPAVAVVQPRARGWFLSMPIADGDTVLCVVASQDIGPWRRGSGDVTSPRDLRRNHVAHAIAVVGLYPRGQALRHVSTTDLVIGSDADDGTRIAIKPSGAVEISQGNTVVVTVDGGGVSHFGPPADTKPVGLDGDSVNATGTSVPPVGMAGWMARVTTAVNALAPGSVPDPPTAIGALAGSGSSVKGT